VSPACTQRVDRPALGRCCSADSVNRGAQHGCQQVATLERIVGGKLVERPGGRRTVFLTRLGELVLQHAEAIVARLQAAQADAEAIVRGDLGALRVGTYQSVGERILPALVPRFYAARPGVEIDLVESESDDELLSHVERGDLDLAFALLPLPDGPFAYVELMTDPWMVLVPADSPLARRDGPVPLDELAMLPLIGARLERCRMQVDAHFRARGLDPRYVFRSDENGAVHGLVAAGVGIGIVPRLAVDPNDERVAALELGTQVAPRAIALAWHRDRYRPAAAEALVELASDLCAELQQEAGMELSATG
jgi:DNA-binding transcriptional LysR family regulator